MIYITGDVHSLKMGGWEQEKVGSEVIAAEKYLKVLKKYNLSCTLFINGKCFEEEKETVKKLLYYDIEIGGHTYNNFGNLNIFRSYINRKIYGCVYGSNSYQKRDILKTKRAFERFGLKMNCWRTHSFGSNEDTFKILKEERIEYVSDLIGDIKPFRRGVIHIPINIPVDQNTIAYGELNPKNRNPLASCVKGRISADEWFEIIKKRVIQNERDKIVSILLIHPMTMAVLDNFELFEEIAKFLSKYKSQKISEFKLG